MTLKQLIEDLLMYHSNRKIIVLGIMTTKELIWQLDHWASSKPVLIKSF